jgi:hypothetical protein
MEEAAITTGRRPRRDLLEIGIEVLLPLVSM